MKTVRLGTPVRVAGFDVVPIEAVQVHGAMVAGGLTFVAAKRPIALVVRSPAGSRALDLAGGDASLDDLLRDVPGLRDWLQRG